MRLSSSPRIKFVAVLTAAICSAQLSPATANDCEDSLGSFYNDLSTANLGVPETPPSPLTPWPPISSCNQASGGGGPGNLRCYGRIVYGIGETEGFSDYRVGKVAGVDTARVEVWDRQTFGDELLWSGYTAPDGCFDTGSIPKGGDSEPDVYLKVVLDNDAVRVDSWCFDNEFEFTWAYDSDNDSNPLFFEDFTGDEIDFGPVMMYRARSISNQFAFDWPADFVAITRAERWLRIQSGLNVNLPKAIIRDPRYLASFYNGDLVHLSRGSVLHEYAHFLLDQLGSVAPGECELLYADTCPVWCPEGSAQLAAQRGFADWFAINTVRELSTWYTWDSGAPWEAERLLETSAAEQVQVCSDTGMFPGDLELVPGMFAAFLRDLTDGQGDDFPWAQDDEKALNADNFSDCSRTSWFDIMSVVLSSAPPFTPRQFVADYAALFPAQRPALYWTAFNIDPDYLLAATFPDSQAPGAVPAAGSRAMGSSPCIPLTVDPPPDDGTGACGYSWEWTQNPAGAAPDTTQEVTGSCALPGPVLPPGDWYVSIRAVDCLGNWSSQYATFGPFEIRDCNLNGITDACEVDCDESVLRDLFDCNIPLTLCDGVACGGNDCNGNLIPDDCDIAQGTAPDCNQDGIPDDCQTDTVQQWTGEASEPLWSDPNNWSLVDNGSGNPTPRVPDENTDVCIPADAMVIVLNTAARAATMRCEGSITVDGSLSTTTLQVAAGSFISGSLAIDGLGARVTGDGVAIGALSLSDGGGLRGDATVQNALGVAGDQVPYFGGNGTLTLAGAATATAPLLFEGGGETLVLQNNSSYDFSGNNEIFRNFFAQVENHGVINRVAGDDVAIIEPACENWGQIICSTGALQFDSRLTNHGLLTTPPGAMLKFRGSADLQPTSVISAGTLRVSNEFTSADTTLRGQVTITDELFVGNGRVIVDANANVTSYGAKLTIAKGQFVIQPVTGNELVFDQVGVLADGFTSSTLELDTTDPVRARHLELRGNLRDANLLTLVDPNDPDAVVLEWYNRGGINFSNIVTDGRSRILPTGTSVTPLSFSTWTNNGVAEFQSGIVMNGDSSRLFNGPSGVINIMMSNNAEAITDQTSPPVDTTEFIENDGVIIKSVSGGDTAIGPTLWNRGDVIADAGNLVLGRFYRQTAGNTLVRGGAIKFTIPSRVFDLEGGTLGGTNTFQGNVNNTAGSVEPGENIPGALTIDGDYAQSNAGTLRVQLGGTNPGIDHDQLIVTGQTDIQGGELVVALVNNFTPGIGSQYTVVQGGTVAQAAFAQVTGDGTFTATTVGNTIVLTFVLPANLAGLADFDNSGIVDAPDATFLSGCMNGPQQPLTPPCDQADLDGDGDVDTTDLYLLQLVFGM